MKFAFIFLIVFTISVIEWAWAQNQKYCDRSLCRGRPHIGCPGNARRQCPSDAAEIVMTARMKSLVLRLHNIDRNVLAGGRVPGLPSARAMPTLVNVSHCSYHNL